VEIDVAAEKIVDARSTRRLVPLELADVAVPPKDSSRSTTALFFRVLGRADGTLRIELWDRGEFHGARVLAGSRENPQLVARRVALAAAELGRRLARKRVASISRLNDVRISREARIKEWRGRTQEGPRALRTELASSLVPDSLWLLGPRLYGEISLAGRWRLDWGGELGVGLLEPSLHAQLYGAGLGPAYRIPLHRSLDLDLGLEASALLLHAPGATTLDGIAHQDTSWTARLRGSVRLELRLSRQLRAALGSELGGVLRGVHYQAGDSAERRLRGVWLGATLGLVVTPWENADGL